jgi:threonine dehydrogenase-like Zn-dependent dehydrogenase
VRPRGTIVLKTTVAGEHRLDLSRAVVNEITVLGSRCGRIPPALAALAAGRIAVEPLIDAVVSLDDGPDGFVRAAAAGALKVLLDARDRT